MSGRIDASEASPVSASMAVSREQHDHPLVPLVVRGRLGHPLVGCYPEFVAGPDPG